ncbi:hypothetical protein [Citrobacter phage Tr1]|nr:hypothetical protein [Citrobacter phage Tr1]
MELKQEDLMPNAKVLSEPEMEAVRGAVFNAVAPLLMKGYSRSEIIEAIHSDTHLSALTALMKLRRSMNKGEAPWQK